MGKKKKAKKGSGRKKTSKPKIDLSSITRAREYAFAMAFLTTYNAAEAARQIGMKTAEAYGPVFFKRPYVQEIITDEMKMRGKAAGITADRVLNELAVLAFASMGDFAKWNGSTVTLTDSSELTRTQARAVQSVSSTMSAQGVPNIRIKLYDKAKALEMLARYLGVIKPDGDGNKRPQAQELAMRIREMVAKADEKSGGTGKPLAKKVAGKETLK